MGSIGTAIKTATPPEGCDGRSPLILLHPPAQARPAAVDVDGKKARPSARPAGLVSADEGPDYGTVGVGEGEGFDGFRIEPVEAAFSHIVGFDPDGAEDAVEEEEPVAAALEGLFADEAQEVEAGEGYVEAGFFLDLAPGALGGGFAQCDIELAADGGAEAEVGGFFAVEEEDAAVFIAEVAEAGQPVGEGAGTGDSRVGCGGGGHWASRVAG